MSEFSEQASLAEIRARLSKLEAAHVGGFGRGLVWFAGFVVVSVVLIVIAAVWSARSDRAATARRVTDRPRITAQQAEGRCETEGRRIYATASDRNSALVEYVPACMRASGFNFTPGAQGCASSDPRALSLTSSCYVKDPAAWPQAKR